MKMLISFFADLVSIINELIFEHFPLKMYMFSSQPEMGYFFNVNHFYGGKLKHLSILKLLITHNYLNNKK